MELDVAALEQELQMLQKQHHLAKEKLAAARDRRPGIDMGRGTGDKPGGKFNSRSMSTLPKQGGVFSRLYGAEDPAQVAGRDPAHRPGGRTSVFDRLYNSRRASGGHETARHDPPPGDGGREQPHSRQSDTENIRQPIQSRLSSRVVAPDGSAAGGSNKQEQHERNPLVPAETPGRKRLLSAVLINGEARTASSIEEKDPAVKEPPPKRPTLLADDRSKRRAQRMLGNLLVGTLQKAKDENEAFRTTAERRQELERRAAEKAAAEAARLKEQEWAARRQERHTHVCQLLDIDLQKNEKLLEIRYAKHIQRKQKLLVFCVTKSQPPIYWLPRAADEQTEALLQEHAASFEEWKQQQLQQLEADKAELAAKIAARKEASAAYASRGGRQQGDGVAEQDTEDVGLEEGDVDGADVGDQQGLQNEAAELDDQAQVELDGPQEQKDEQLDGNEEQQQHQQDDDDDDDDGADVDQMEVEAEPERRSSRRQRHGDDDEEERLLSSEDEEDV